MCLVTPGARSRTLPESHRSPHLPARRSATGSTDAVTESSVEEPKRGFATTPETPRKDSASGPRSPSPTRVSTSPSPSREAPERCSPTRRARYARADSRSPSHGTPSTGPVSPQPSRPRGERQPPKRACGTDSRARTCETRANAPQRSKRGPDTTSRARGAPSASHHRRTFCAPGGRGQLPTRGSRGSVRAQLRHTALRTMDSLLNGTHCERLAPLGGDKCCVDARSGPMSCGPASFAGRAICATAVPLRIGIGSTLGSCR